MERKRVWFLGQFFSISKEALHFLCVKCESAAGEWAMEWARTINESENEGGMENYGGGKKTEDRQKQQSPSFYGCFWAL
jgi:hypothetical protein